MQVYLACSKTMVSEYSGIPLPVSTPAFLNDARAIVEDLNGYSAAELSEILNVSPALARQNKLRLMDFEVPDKALPAIMGYTGTAYKALDSRSLSVSDLQYADKHLLIGSFLYGMNRPFDMIHPYRLEGNVTLALNGHENLFQYWKPILTDWFINEVKKDDGVLVNVASNEYMNILEWKKVCKELDVITPQFKIDFGDKIKTVALYAKMCRGAMARWIVTNRISNPDDLAHFEYQGFINQDKNLFVKTLN